MDAHLSHNPSLRRRNRSLDSPTPTSPLSRAGSLHFRSPLSQLQAAAVAASTTVPDLPRGADGGLGGGGRGGAARRRESARAQDDDPGGRGRRDEGGGRDGGESKNPPSFQFQPFEPLLFRTPYRNRSARGTAVHVWTASPVTSHTASFHRSGSITETVGTGRTATAAAATDVARAGRRAAARRDTGGLDASEVADAALFTTAPLSRVWSTPDIQWPLVMDTDDEDEGLDMAPKAAVNEKASEGTNGAPNGLSNGPPNRAAPKHEAATKPEENHGLPEGMSDPLEVSSWAPLRIRRRRSSTPSDTNRSHSKPLTGNSNGSTPNSTPPSTLPPPTPPAARRLSQSPPPPTLIEPTSPSIAHIVAPTPISPEASVHRPRPLSIDLTVNHEEPLVPRSEPSPLRRTHAISRRPSPAGPAQTEARGTRPHSHSISFPVPTATPPPSTAHGYSHSYSQSLNLPLPSLAPLDTGNLPAGVPPVRTPTAGVPPAGIPTGGRRIVSHSPQPGSRQSLYVPPAHPTARSLRRHSDMGTLGRHAASDPVPATAVWAATEVATYGHVLLRASAFAQHLSDRSHKSATVGALLAFLHASPEDPMQLAALLHQLGVALVEDRIASGGLQALLDHLARYPGFDALFTTVFAVRLTCTSCGLDTHTTPSNWAAPHSGASVAGVRRRTAWCGTCGATEHVERWAPKRHGPLLIVEPDGLVHRTMADRAAGARWALVGAAVPTEGGLGFIAQEGGWTLYKGRERVPVDLSQPVPMPVFALYERV